jgi:hypothetical protein
MTPASPAPIWLARRIRCASPPDRVSALRSKVRYSSPTSTRKRSRSFTSFRTLTAIWPLCPSIFRDSKNRNTASTGMAVTSGSERPPTKTCRAAKVSRVPPHAGQGVCPRNFASSSRTRLDPVSR